MDGISNPAVSGFSTPLPGQAVVAPGIILTGEQGDGTNRPSWATDGSFLAFRQLEQRVPEFNKFLLDNALSEPNLNVSQNAELLGARMMGRWKSVSIYINRLSLLLHTDSLLNSYFLGREPRLILHPLRTILSLRRILNGTTTSTSPILVSTSTPTNLIVHSPPTSERITLVQTWVEASLIISFVPESLTGLKVNFCTPYRIIITHNDSVQSLMLKLLPTVRAQILTWNEV